MRAQELQSCRLKRNLSSRELQTQYVHVAYFLYRPLYYQKFSLPTYHVHFYPDNTGWDHFGAHTSSLFLRIKKFNHSQFCHETSSICHMFGNIEPTCNFVYFIGLPESRRETKIIVGAGLITHRVSSSQTCKYRLYIIFIAHN